MRPCISFAVAQGHNCKRLDEKTFFLSAFEVLQGPNYALAQMMRHWIAGARWGGGDLEMGAWIGSSISLYQYISISNSCHNVTFTCFTPKDTNG